MKYNNISIFVDDKRWTKKWPLVNSEVNILSLYFKGNGVQNYIKIRSNVRDFIFYYNQGILYSWEDGCQYRVYICTIIQIVCLEQESELVSNLRLVNYKSWWKLIECTRCRSKVWYGCVFVYIWFFNDNLYALNIFGLQVINIIRSIFYPNEKSC